jgi:hypothetical protein
VKPSAYTIDERRYPLVIASAHPRHVRDEAALDETYRLAEAVLARERPVVLLLDLRGAVSSPSRRKRFAAWMSPREATIKRVIIAMAVVVGNQIERGFVTAVAWLKPPPVETRVFTDLLAAEQWLLALHEAAQK